MSFYEHLITHFHNPEIDNIFEVYTSWISSRSTLTQNNIRVRSFDKFITFRFATRFGFDKKNTTCYSSFLHSQA